MFPSGSSLHFHVVPFFLSYFDYASGLHIFMLSVLVLPISPLGRFPPPPCGISHYWMTWWTILEIDNNFQRHCLPSRWAHFHLPTSVVPPFLVPCYTPELRHMLSWILHPVRCKENQGWMMGSSGACIMGISSSFLLGVGVAGVDRSYKERESVLLG